MTGIHKFFHMVIHFVFLFLVVYGSGITEKECITDDDCNRKYPMHANRGLQCLNGECKSSRIIKSR